MSAFSISKLLSWEKCPRQYRLRYVDGIVPEKRAVSLFFGSAVHAAFEAAFLGGDGEKCREAFLGVFDKDAAPALAAAPGDEDFHNEVFRHRDAGEAFARTVPEAVRAEGLTAYARAGGGAEVESTHVLDLGGGDSLTTRLDSVVVGEDLSPVVLDIKTTSSASSFERGWVGASDQLIAQVMGYEQDGGERVTAMGFWPVVKGKALKVAPPVLAPPPSEEVRREMVYKWKWTISQIRAGVFPRRPQEAYNSPCRMCDYRGLCLHGDWTGLRKK